MLVKKRVIKKVQMISKSREKKIPKNSPLIPTVKRVPIKSMANQETNQRVSQTVSGGRIR